MTIKLNAINFDSQKSFNELLAYVLNYIFQSCASNAKVGHRNRLNIFDIIKLFRNLRITQFELIEYVEWFKSDVRHSNLIYEFFPRTFSGYPKGCELDLTFGIDVNETKRAGFDFLPPAPSSFTYKYTPIYGKREEDALTVLKKRTEEKLKIENNLYLSSKSKTNINVVNYDEI